jgi:hypothetical protein
MGRDKLVTAGLQEERGRMMEACLATVEVLETDQRPEPNRNGHLAHLVGADGHLVKWWLGFMKFDYRRVYPIIGDHFAICAVCEELDAAVRWERQLGLQVVQHHCDSPMRQVDFDSWKESRERVVRAQAAYEALSTKAHLVLVPVAS